ncbi:MAG: radical SAM protein [Verrucomicrobiales bacterium]|nr:radical SAM protein [Verrucomicrobiales bacterium]
MIPADLARDQWREWLQQSSSNQHPVALYLHTPFCHHRCAFCPFYINRASPGYSRTYTDLLLREIAGTPAPGRTVNSVFFGGGTPSDLATEDLVRVLEQLRKQWQWTNATEITVEARIRGFTADKARIWWQAGVNRFSLGVQTTDSQLRRSLGRLADRREILDTLQQVTAATHAHVSVDLLYGLPGQTPEMLREDIRLLTDETAISGITCYELACFPNSPMAQAISQGRLPALPDSGQLASLYFAVREELADSGFFRHSLVHWHRRANDRCVYNRHVKDGGDLVPYGSGAGGNIGDRQLMLSRTLEEYRSLVSNDQKPITFASRLNLARRQIQAGITSGFENMRLRPESFEILGRDGRDYMAKILEQWRKSKLLDYECQLTPGGEFWAKTMEKNLLAAASHFA